MRFRTGDNPRNNAKSRLTDCNDCLKSVVWSREMRAARILFALLVFEFAVCAASQRAPYRNQEYGIVLPFPPDTLPCVPPAYQGNGADHGPQILLGTQDASFCSKSSGKRYVDVFASYNTTDDTKTLHALLESSCEYEVKRACSAAPPNLQFSGRKSEAGRLDRSDGSLEIIVVTQAGKPGPDFDASVPSINYELFLNTDKRDFVKDLTVFRTLLMTIRISPPNR